MGQQLVLSSQQPQGWRIWECQPGADNQRSCSQCYHVLFAPKPLSAKNFHEELSLQLQGCSGADLLGQGFIASVRIMGALGKQKPSSCGKVKNVGEARDLSAVGILGFDRAP